jgi:uncharacterized lipoprotein
MKLKKFKVKCADGKEVELIEIRFDNEDATSVTVKQAKELISKLQKAINE